MLIGDGQHWMLILTTCRSLKKRALNPSDIACFGNVLTFFPTSIDLPESGRILIDGVDISTVSKEALRSRVVSRQALLALWLVSVSCVSDS